MSQITIVALVIFAITYLLMMIFQKIRPYIVGVSALIFVALGTIATLKPDLFGAGFFALGTETFSYGIMDAISNIDWNVIMMIAGTMGTVYLFIESKMPQLLSDILISKMPNVKWVVVVISLFAGIVSAFVDNVATVLMIAPVALAFCKKLNISPVPAIICIAVSSNLQGAATLVGDTTSKFSIAICLVFITLPPCNLFTTTYLFVSNALFSASVIFSKFITIVLLSGTSFIVTPATE